jgi:hypothetical protein
MSRRVDFTLNDEQLAEIEQAINYSPHPEVRQRAIAIRLHPNWESLQTEIDTRMSNQNLPDHPDRLLFVDNLRSVA